MTLFDNILLQSIFIIFPLSIWLIYQIYIKNIDRKRNNIAFDVSLFTMTYLMSKIMNPKYSYILYFTLNIPIILAFTKRREITFIIISIFHMLFLSNVLSENINILIVEEITFYLIYKLLSLKKQESNKEIIIFSTLKSFFAYSYFIYKNSSLIELYEILIVGFIFYFLIYFTIFLLKKSEDMIYYANAISLLDEEKRLRSSLFKITHEIKNPIAVCKGYLDMFDTENKEHGKKYIPILKEEISKVLTLLQDFLSIGKIKIEKETLDINYLLENVLDCVSPLLKEKKIKAEINISDEEIFMDADYNRLNQVIINLIKNSIESMALKEEKKIKIYTKEEKNNIKIVIEDSGIGIDDANLKRISEPFFTTKKSGTGLGVYLSQIIIKEHGGNIKYVSSKGIGTKVTITLPLNNSYT
jgi:signal transduction histidine kinase